MCPYRYTNLTNAVKQKDSPLRQYLGQRFPNVRVLQAEFRARGSSLQVEGGEATPGTLGAAFDFQERFVLDPTVPPVIAARAFVGRRDCLQSIFEVMRLATDATASVEDREILGRACWALALCTEVYRLGGVPPGSPLAALLANDRFRTANLLALAPRDALRQLREMDALAATSLRPRLGRPLHLGPTFDASELCSADADLIAAGLLLDIKTHLGAKNKNTGVRSDGLSLIDLYQVLAYALFDHSDTYRITDIGIYSARYGTLVTWPITAAMRSLADGPVDLGQERSRVWSLLGGVTG